jgi:DNA invertase Pin-like site-specific DNA recombinase
MEAAGSREYDVLVVYDTSRLARDIWKLKVVERQSARAGITVRYVHQQFDDGPAGQLQKDIMSAVDSFERGDLAVRFKMGKRAKIGRGLVMGQRQGLYGFQRVVDDNTHKTMSLEIEPEAASDVRRIVCELRVRSVESMEEMLNGENISSPSGGRWSGATVFKILNNPAIVGSYVHGKTRDIREGGRIRRVEVRAREEWVGVAVPPIVSQADVEAAREAMMRRKATHGARRANAETDPFTVRGFLKCGRCGGPLSTASQEVNGRLANGTVATYSGPEGFRYYQCIRSKSAHAERANPPTIPAPPASAAPLTAAMMGGRAAKNAR